MSANITEPTRLLIGGRFLEEVVGILEQACLDDPEHWTKHIDEPATVDHYGYHDDTMSCVVLTKEWRMTYYRLTIRPGRDRVFDLLAALAAQSLTPA